MNTSPATEIDRRTNVRAVVNHAFSSLDELMNEYVANVSRGGLFIRSDDPLPVGTKVTLRCTVILDDLETIEGVGEVVRTVFPPDGPTPGMGVVFTELTDHSKRLIEQLLVRRHA